MRLRIAADATAGGRNESRTALRAEVAADRIPERLGEIERLRAIPVAFVQGTHYSSRGVIMDHKNGNNCVCAARGGS